MAKRRGDGWWNGNYIYIRRPARDSGYEPPEIITETPLTGAELAEHLFQQYARRCAACDSKFMVWPLPPTSVVRDFPNSMSLINAIENSTAYKLVRAEQDERLSNPSIKPWMEQVRESPRPKKALKSSKQSLRNRLKLKLGNPTHEFGSAGLVLRRLEYCMQIAEQVDAPTNDWKHQLGGLVRNVGGKVEGTRRSRRYSFPDGTILFIGTGVLGT